MARFSDQLPPLSVMVFGWPTTLMDTLDAMYHAVEDMFLEFEVLELIERMLAPEASKKPEDSRLVALLRSGWQALRGIGGNLQRFTQPAPQREKTVHVFEEVRKGTVRYMGGAEYLGCPEEMRPNRGDRNPVVFYGLVSHERPIGWPRNSKAHAVVG